jgi:small GTP-binding protein
MQQTIPQLKLVMLGDESVGKTSLLNCWIRHSFDQNSAPTIGGAAQAKRDQVDDEHYCFQIWDTAGAEKFRALAPLYARDSHAACIVFDLTRRKTYDSLSDWVKFLQQYGEIPFVLIGNKEDIEGKQEVTIDEGTEFAFSVSTHFFPTSAKTGANVDLAFKQVEQAAVESFKKSTPTVAHPMVPLDPAAVPESSGCC